MVNDPSSILGFPGLAHALQAMKSRERGQDAARGVLADGSDDSSVASVGPSKSQRDRSRYLEHEGYKCSNVSL